MDSETRSYEKGELVPHPGTYRCNECGEIWTTREVGVRFPPCDANKTGVARWTEVTERAEA